MRIIGQLRNPIQNYPWGSQTAIRGLFGDATPAPRPEAELWLGAHPKAPSEIEIDGTWHRLDAWLQGDPAALGDDVRQRLGGQLPFLFKVLAAARPLSIQAHPDAAQARVGFDDEERRGIARDAPDRTYRDPNPKPELIYALTPFWMLRGLRSADEIIRRLDELGLTTVWPAAAALARDGAPGLPAFLEAWLALDPASTRRWVDIALSRASKQAAASTADQDALRWLIRLGNDHPDDPGALAPLVLDTFALAPGEAVFTGPGVLHAYLDGLGLEVMANSDNVLRGGLTGKHVDAGALLGVLDLEASGRGRVAGVEVAPGVDRFAPPGAGFELTIVDLDRLEPDTAIDPGWVAVVLAADAHGAIAADGAADGAATPAIEFGAGDSVLVAGPGGVRVRGKGRVFFAGC